MSHPIGTHISKEQNHELNYWLEKNGFKESKENRAKLKAIIDNAKTFHGKESSQHLTHDELNDYYKTIK
ncbi:hypothetical protein [Proteus terrae]|uniref:hypothetical protein n=1 Tax=Proteus terrae TaxID=1574161 RepID=UPI00131FD9C1|nr:hypothetical protein [Proteus terrae]QHD94424.1 hypothetical protein GSM99_07585 [Proteus terrae subsp. cibarius]QIF96810.1 hypothetical protein GTH25_01550 [Proteus terrae subsp. cibarius]QJW49700.1 hypothetical protein HND96_01775 [Proteus terrae subsp. cibarius]QUT02176.1 hypothetical protein KF949_01725 [Proteus terrae subsp. cibarius]WCG90746.1 hypothetical protein ONR67_01560 [Proteus terrae]